MICVRLKIILYIKHETTSKRIMLISRYQLKVVEKITENTAVEIIRDSQK